MAKLDLTKLSKTPAAAPAPAEAPKPAGLAFLKSKTAAPATPAPTPTPAATPKPAGGLGFLASQAAKTPAPTPSKPVDTTPEPDLDGDIDLDSLMNSSAGGGSKPTVRAQSRFNDEVPADSPPRDNTALDKQQMMFVDSLDSVYKIVHEPDMLGGVIKNIMMELAQKPEYRKLIQPKDIHTMIKGMRDSMGMAKIRKEESKAKRGGGGRKKTSKVDDLDTLAALDEAFAGVEL